MITESQVNELDSFNTYPPDGDKQQLSITKCDPGNGTEAYWVIRYGKVTTLGYYGLSDTIDQFITECKEAQYIVDIDHISAKIKSEVFLEIKSELEKHEFNTDMNGWNIVPKLAATMQLLENKYVKDEK